MENINYTKFELGIVKYARNEETGYCVKTEGSKHTRISKAEFEAAYDQWVGRLVEEAEEGAATEAAAEIAEEMDCDVDAPAGAEEATESHEDEQAASGTREAVDAKEEPRKAKKTPRKKKVQVGGMEFSENGVSVVLTEKQVKFIQLLPVSNFWENGVDSALWVDVLCDELADWMGPMTIGAMVSTLREKGLLLVGKDNRNHKEKKVAFFEFSELGKKVASKILGL